MFRFSEINYPISQSLFVIGLFTAFYFCFFCSNKSNIASFAVLRLR